MKRASFFALSLCLSCFSLAACVSAGRQAAADRDRCAAQGLTQQSSAFDDCVAAASAGRREAEARQDLGMRQLHEHEVDDFLTSTSVHP